MTTNLFRMTLMMKEINLVKKKCSGSPTTAPEHTRKITMTRLYPPSSIMSIANQTGAAMDLYNITSQEILDRISRHCPEALSVYLQCLNRAGEDGNVFFSRQMVEVDMSERWSPFVSRVKKLALENLLEWHPFLDGISITLADINDGE